ncbi:hypothetical protein N7462_001800 [Penicillium macrosclerotiorum]|uniref:uncharacterized protein n=1 Tax=Penicillium macrosclerotiorum TaxID=303699 RepID=UPI002548E58E|nr:uncharacterized protein N7462_001800 [Penicillium macrosclerotiorum]KAJ5692377.1 hypothetical protein N7462_001800 [Penicillium macrosclerotiorum]
MTAQNINIESLDKKMQAVLDAFEAHPLLQPPTPHPTVFFLADFIRNSHKTLKEVDAEKYASGDKESASNVQEVVGRNQFAGVLVNDSSGKLALLTGSDPGSPVNFGSDIKAKVRAMLE